MVDRVRDTRGDANPTGSGRGGSRIPLDVRACQEVERSVESADEGLIVWTGRQPRSRRRSDSVGASGSRSDSVVRAPLTSESLLAQENPQDQAEAARREAARREALATIHTMSKEELMGCRYTGALFSLEVHTALYKPRGDAPALVYTMSKEELNECRDLGVLFQKEVDEVIQERRVIALGKVHTMSKEELNTYRDLGALSDAEVYDVLHRQNNYRQWRGS